MTYQSKTQYQKMSQNWEKQLNNFSVFKLSSSKQAHNSLIMLNLCLRNFVLSIQFRRVASLIKNFFFQFMIFNAFFVIFLLMYNFIILR